MSSIPVQSRRRDEKSEPTWAIAELFPTQGDWSEDEYLMLPGNRLIELSDGRVELLPMPTMAHQLIVAYLYNLLHQFVTSNSLGVVLFAALPMRLEKGKYREPDVLFMTSANKHRMSNQYWEGADLVMEVVSENDPKRDLETKREEYAKAGILEYWIVNPRLRQITVLQLDGKQYVAHGDFRSGQRASSPLLSGFEADVEKVFAAANV